MLKVDPSLRKMKPNKFKIAFWPFHWQALNVTLFVFESKGKLYTNTFATRQNFWALIVSIISAATTLVVSFVVPGSLIPITIAAIVAYGIGIIIRTKTYGHEHTSNFFAEMVLALLWGPIAFTIVYWIVIFVISRFSSK